MWPRWGEFSYFTTNVILYFSLEITNSGDGVEYFWEYILHVVDMNF